MWTFIFNLIYQTNTGTKKQGSFPLLVPLWGHSQGLSCTGILQMTQVFHQKMFNLVKPLMKLSSTSSRHIINKSCGVLNCTLSRLNVVFCLHTQFNMGMRVIWDTYPQSTLFSMCSMYKNPSAKLISCQGQGAEYWTFLSRSQDVLLLIHICTPFMCFYFSFCK